MINFSDKTLLWVILGLVAIMFITNIFTKQSESGVIKFALPKLREPKADTPTGDEDEEADE